MHHDLHPFARDATPPGSGALSGDGRHALTMVRHPISGPERRGGMTAPVHAEQYPADRRGARLAHAVPAEGLALRRWRPVDFRCSRADRQSCSNALSGAEALPVAAFAAAQRRAKQGLGGPRARAGPWPDTGKPDFAAPQALEPQTDNRRHGSRYQKEPS